MLQKDYLLREIEKVGLILGYLRQKILGQVEKDSSQKQAYLIGETLSKELNFNLDNFLTLDLEDSLKYLENFKGFDNSNIELLANCLAEAGFCSPVKISQEYLQKALHLYEFLNQETKTFSLERVQNIQRIQEALD